MKNKEKNILIKLFCIMGKIGCIGFGGGNALIPVLQKNVVEKAHLIEADEYEEDVVVANITPGALPVEVAGGTGKRVAGWKGMLAGSMGMAFPGVFFTVLLLSIMPYLSPDVLVQIEFLTVGVTAFIACLLTDYIMVTLKKASADRNVGIHTIIIAGAFGLTCGKNLLRLLGVDRTPVFGLAAIHIFILVFFIIFFTSCEKSFIRTSIALVLCGLYVLCAGRMQLIQSHVVYDTIRIVMVILACAGLKRQFGKEIRTNAYVRLKATAKELLALVVLLAAAFVLAGIVTDQAYRYLANGFLSSIMSFGGGDAYLTVAEGLFVNAGLVTEDAFYGSVVPLVNILPGSILCKTLSGVGFFVGYAKSQNIFLGCLTAFAGFICSIVASCGVFSVVSCIYGSFEKVQVFQLIKRWIRPIVSGLMLNVILALVYQNRKLGIAEGMDWIPVLGMLGIYGLDVYLYFFRKVNNGRIILLSVIVSFVLCNVCAV